VAEALGEAAEAVADAGGVDGRIGKNRKRDGRFIPGQAVYAASGSITPQPRGSTRQVMEDDN
jgi:hypothetical protein